MASTIRKPSAASNSTIRITATPKKRVSVELLGIDYMIKPPKSSLLLAISSHAGSDDTDANGVSEDFANILKLMFTPADLPKVQARLNSPDDELDLDHIFETVEKLTEAATGNPTS